jgi:hypothetical protein
MAASYQVNLNINAGTTFSQEFFLTNPDKSPTNITGYKFYAKMAKHSTAMVATQSTRDNPVYSYIPMTATVADGVGGKYKLYMSSKKTAKLSEGKYVYSVVAQDLNGNKSEVVDGLVFVERGFASPDSETVFDGGGASLTGDEIILDGGTSGSY